MSQESARTPCSAGRLVQRLRRSNRRRLLYLGALAASILLVAAVQGILTDAEAQSENPVSHEQIRLEVLQHVRFPVAANIAIRLLKTTEGLSYTSAQSSLCEAVEIGMESIDSWWFLTRELPKTYSDFDRWAKKPLNQRMREYEDIAAGCISRAVQGKAADFREIKEYTAIISRLGQPQQPTAKH